MRSPRAAVGTAVLAMLALLIGAGLLAGCGSSSKPAYCSPVSKVENAVKSLPTVGDVKKNGVGTLKSAVLQSKQNATAAVNQAKSDFEPDDGTEDLGGRAVEHGQAGRGARPRGQEQAGPVLGCVP